jgi:hypothetical protein
VRSSRDVLELIEKAQEHSSRSHLVATLRVASREAADAEGVTLTTSKLHLIDLAGSERQKATGLEGERSREGAQINLSLSCLCNVIKTLAEQREKGKARHVPYRDSKLTRLLQDSLGGNSYTAVICNVSPARASVDETVSSLRFAERAKKIQNSVVVNRDPKNERILQLMLEKTAMQATIARQDAHISRLEQWYDLSQ